jgi:AmiR/NasT family two-component response regulator
VIGHSAHTLSENLKQAMESRAPIEQAKGIIMGSMSCDANEAFAILKVQSQRQNLKVRDLAEEIVRNTMRPNPVTGG